tara:strand:- start:13396 stop:13686 length:291 start_codon:yes stop_codon:yes gene_type:complete
LSTYLIAEVNLKNLEDYSEYLSEVPKIISKYNGEYLVRGGKISHHEGEWKPKRVVVVKFPTRKEALAFYDSKEYNRFKIIRNKVADSNLIFVDGIS